MPSQLLLAVARSDSAFVNMRTRSLTSVSARYFAVSTTICELHHENLRINEVITRLRAPHCTRKLSITPLAPVRVGVNVLGQRAGVHRRDGAGFLRKRGSRALLIEPGSP